MTSKSQRFLTRIASSREVEVGGFKRRGLKPPERKKELTFCVTLYTDEKFMLSIQYSDVSTKL